MFHRIFVFFFEKKDENPLKHPVCWKIIRMKKENLFFILKIEEKGFKKNGKSTFSSRQEKIFFCLLEKLEKKMKKSGKK